MRISPPTSSSWPSLSTIWLQAIVLALCIQRGTAIICFDCHSDQGTCNEGECEGLVCVKMETSNIDDDRRTVQKGCGLEYEESECQQTGLGSKWTSRCVCDQPLCNGDAALIASGLEPPVEGAPRPGFLVILLCSFVVSILLNF
ncbi:hypothetical protein L596_007099 [Steinernema carpocapsae]|uniref:Activin types I and II receptor domain-containing protein n=1 Tax=Steinernema carpocapsae TaxID=34508 RepID=A0A4U5P8M9_STECR|nr:hypothetical protein L596_007099 [Steinernema carpocapsae]